MACIARLPELCSNGAALLPSLALVHKGVTPIQGFATGFAHPVDGLDLLPAMLTAGLWAAQLGGRAAGALPLGFMAALALGAAMGSAGVPLPLVEPGILGSLVVVGLALAWRVRPAIEFAVVATFALFHGHAQGAEMPAGASVAAYALGSLAATRAAPRRGRRGGSGRAQIGPSAADPRDGCWDIDGRSDFVLN